MLKPRLPTLTEDTISKNPVIVGGMPADYGQFPHQALLKIDDSYVCGGSLIGSKWILTAAHCALEWVSIDYFILLGGKTYFRFICRRYMFEIYCGSVSWRLYSETSIWTTVSYTAIVHENYNPSLLSNDIAVIKLTTSAPSNSTTTHELMNTSWCHILYFCARLFIWNMSFQCKIWIPWILSNWTTIYRE